MREMFLNLVRQGLGIINDVMFPDVIDWNAIQVLAEQQGLSAIVLDGIETLPEQSRPPKEFLLTEKFPLPWANS